MGFDPLTIERRRRLWFSRTLVRRSTRTRATRDKFHAHARGVDLIKRCAAIRSAVVGRAECGQQRATPGRNQLDKNRAP